MQYSEKLLEHFENPRNVGSFADDEENVGTGVVGSPACGDVMKIQIKVDPETDRIIDVKFKTFGCGSAIASSSLVTEFIKGKTTDEAASIENKDIAKELDLPPIKVHCSILAKDAIKDAIEDYRKRTSGEISADAPNETKMASVDIANENCERASGSEK